MDEPVLRAYVQESMPPASHYEERPGRWVAEASWPSASIADRRLALNPGSLDTAGNPLPLSLASPATTGAAGGEWCPYGLGGLGPELPTDQRADDAWSLVFDGAPLGEPLEILGAAVVDLDVQSDRPVATVVARLGDVAPDGRVTRVTYGVLNLTHRESHAAPTPLQPGQRYKVRLRLNDIGHRFLAGHRIRLALSTAYWPIVWPAPQPAVLTVMSALSSLSLPVRNPGPEDSKVRFTPPEKPTPTRRRVIRPGAVHRRITQDIGSGEQLIEVLRDDGQAVVEATGIETAFHKILRYRIHPDDPATARAEADYELLNRHDRGWETRVRTHSAIACTPTAFIIEADLEAFEGEIRVFSRSWTERILRDLC